MALGLHQKQSPDRLAGRSGWSPDLLPDSAQAGETAPWPYLSDCTIVILPSFYKNEPSFCRVDADERI